jgi:hypothetical protein
MREHCAEEREKNPVQGLSGIYKISILLKYHQFTFGAEHNTIFSYVSIFYSLI